MSETVAVAIIVALTGVIGPPVVEELRAFFRRRRAADDRRRRRQLRAIDETRQKVTFEVQQGEKGLRAANVVPVD